MTGSKRRRLDRSGRAKLRSPGRPPVGRREDRQRFWAAIAAGCSSEAAAADARVSPVVGVRWFRESGGMPPSHLTLSYPPLSGRYLSFSEREQIALFRVQRHGVREIARRLGRAASTISRELRRNAATRSGGLEYRAATAQWHADRATRRPKLAKLATHAALRQYVQDRLAGGIVAPRTARRCAGRRCRGRGAVMGAGSLAAGVARGARRRLRIGSPVTSRMTRRCASATKRSTRRCTSRAAALCAVT